MQHGVAAMDASGVDSGTWSGSARRGVSGAARCRCAVYAFARQDAAAAASRVVWWAVGAPAGDDQRRTGRAHGRRSPLHYTVLSLPDVLSDSQTDDVALYRELSPELRLRLRSLALQIVGDGSSAERAEG